MNERVKELYNQSLETKFQYGGSDAKPGEMYSNYIRVLNAEKFARLVALECIDKIETYRIPVGNSASGELACEWTYQALLEIRDEIRQHFGIEP